MIAQTIESDHDAGKEVFAVVGNAAQPAWDERAGEMEALARLWEVHGVMLDRAVLPRLDAAAGVGGLPDLNRRVAAMAADLAVRARQSHDDGRWLVDFETLKRLFDEQCGIEDTELVPLIRDRAAPDAVAEMTRTARALREPRAA